MNTNLFMLLFLLLPVGILGPDVVEKHTVPFYSPSGGTTVHNFTMGDSKLQITITLQTTCFGGQKNPHKLTIERLRK